MPYDESTYNDDLPRGKGDPDVYGYPGQEADEPIETDKADTSDAPF